MTTTPEELRRFVRRYADEYLNDPNVSSIGIGLKIVDGRVTDTVSVQFTVFEKLPDDQIEVVGSSKLPETVTVEATAVPTDVVQRSYAPAYDVVAESVADERKVRRDPVVPGISVSHPAGTAGTLGCIVYGREDGTAYALSNWHVLQGGEGKVGDTVVQPGPHDDNRIDRNHMGRLVRSHLGIAGDCAIATIEGRGVDAAIEGLDVAPTEIGDPHLGDKVVKSGRTTAVTHGVVTRVDTVVKLDYGPGVGQQRIGGFEIGPDRSRNADARLSDGGDSGSAWLFRAGNGRPTRVLAGLHFGGEAGGGDEHALACLPRSVFEKLELTLDTKIAEAARTQAARAPGYDPQFLGQPVPTPDVTPDLHADLVSADGSTTIDHTHFSLAQSTSRRFARWVAWNVDGRTMKKLSRSSMKFRLDPKVPKKAQCGDELYAGNDLDRGHIARRADLTWGPDAEKANADSFYFTNITPQMNDFNQGARGGVWGQLEDAVYADVEVDHLRISVFGGPIFHDDDRVYRGVKIPREFFKVIAFVEKDDLKARAFLLTQSLDHIEALELPAFTTYQVTLDDLTERSGVVFPQELAGSVIQAVSEPKELRTTADIVW